VSKYRPIDFDGPCIIEYRDWAHNGHPQRRDYSCWGCRWLDVNEYGESHCGHPAFIAEYGCHQYIGGDFQNQLKRVVHWMSCPVLRTAGAKQLEQPPEDKLDRDSVYRPDGDVFRIPQVRPYYLPDGEDWVDGGDGPRSPSAATAETATTGPRLTPRLQGEGA
jgi:hypothetical protein